jgi:hypothetical protein
LRLWRLALVQPNIRPLVSTPTRDDTADLHVVLHMRDGLIAVGVGAKAGGEQRLLQRLDQADGEDDVRLQQPP